MYMKAVKENIRNSAGTAQEVDPKQVLNISQARPLFSHMVNRVEERPFFIGNRGGTPLAVLVSYSVARGFLPKNYLAVQETLQAVKSPTEAWWDSYNAWLVSQPKPKKRTINISENVDKYLYK